MYSYDVAGNLRQALPRRIFRFAAFHGTLQQFPFVLGVGALVDIES